MPRFLHTSDLHINALRRFSDHSQAAYLRRMVQTLEGIHKAARKHRVDFTIVAGDIWERRDILHQERQVLTDWLASSPVPIVMISGNHDVRSSQIGDTSLSYLSRMTDILGKHFIHDGLPLIKSMHGCQLLLFPARDPSHGWKDAEVYLMVHSMVRYAQRHREPIIVVLHENVVGSKTDTGLMVTSNAQVHLEPIDGVTYWALGDIHKRQSILPNAWYCGAPHQTRFGEDLDKGVLVVDTADPTNPKYVPIRSTKLIELHEVPDVWPSAAEAFVKLHAMPTSTMPLPMNVEPGEEMPARALPQNARRVHGIFDGLDNTLLQAGLPEEYLPHAFKFVDAAAKELGVSFSNPYEDD